ncbi:MAG: hypothetical protein ACREXK_02515 [Gammaproteobacteria bacterium]
MATVNFSVPADVKQLFNETFANRNKSAVIAELTLEAVERERRRSLVGYASRTIALGEWWALWVRGAYPMIYDQMSSLVASVARMQHSEIREIQATPTPLPVRGFSFGGAGG